MNNIMLQWQYSTPHSDASTPTSSHIPKHPAAPRSQGQEAQGLQPRQSALPSVSNGGGGWRSTALPSGHHHPALPCAQVERLLARAITFPCAHNHWIELVLYQQCRVSHQLPSRSPGRQLWGLRRCYQVFAYVGDRHQGLITQQLGPCR